MSCDTRRKKWLSRACGGDAAQIDALEQVYRENVGAPADEEEARINQHMAKVLFLRIQQNMLADIRAGTFQVPTHSRTGLPPAQQQRGYAAMYRALRAWEQERNPEPEIDRNDPVPVEGILTHHGIDAPLDAFTRDADGHACLALLCNAAAKGDERFYQHKARLITEACLQAGRERSWVDEDRGMKIYYIESGLHYNGESAQLSFHVPPDSEHPDLPDWPEANGRGWRGQYVQARAVEIALDYLARTMEA